MSDKEIEMITFQLPDQALFDSLQQLIAATERRERVEEWLGWEQEQLYGQGEMSATERNIKRMLGP